MAMILYSILFTLLASLELRSQDFTRSISSDNKITLSNNCIPADHAKFILSEFEFLEKKQAGYRRITSIELCQPSEVIFHVVRSLSHLIELSPHVPLVAEGWGPKFEEKPFEYFHHRIEKIYLQKADHLNCKNNGRLAAFVVFHEKRTLHICPAFAKAVPEVIKTSLLVHEARHIDGFRHVRCSQGFFAGKDRRDSACDPSYDNLGSYGIETSFLISLARSPYLLEEDRQQARIMARLNLTERFNKVPFGIKKGALARFTSGKTAFFDGTSFLQTPIQIAMNAVLTIQSKTMILFDSATRKVKIHHYPSTWIEDRGEISEFYIKNLSEFERSSLLDVQYAHDYDYLCFLFSDKIRCLQSSEDMIDIHFTKIQPIKIHKTQTSSYFPSNALMIVDRFGQMFELPSKYEKLRGLTESKIEKVSGLPSVRGSVRLDSGIEFGITLEGMVGSLGPKKGIGPILSPMNQPEAVDSFISPFYWSEKFREL